MPEPQQRPLTQAEIEAQDDERIRTAIEKRASQLQGQYQQGMQQSLQQGADRGQQLFAEGSFATRPREAITADIQDVLNRRRSGLEGFNAEENNALRSQMMQNIARNTQGEQRALRAQQAAAGVRGPLAAAQQSKVIASGGANRAQAERDLFLQNIAQRNQNLGAFEQSVASELQRSQQEKLGQLSTELGYGQLGAANQAAASQAAIGEQQAAAARQQARNAQGKK